LATKADVAELVDARDLKFFAPLDKLHVFCITPSRDTMENDAKRPDLHNVSGGVRVVERVEHGHFR
jgi:hypothetical protein